jgi:hypothetical protein
MIIALGETLGMRTIAEGIQDARQASSLRDMRCRWLRDYYFSAPVAPKIPATRSLERDHRRMRSSLIPAASSTPTGNTSLRCSGKPRPILASYAWRPAHRLTGGTATIIVAVR